MGAWGGRRRAVPGWGHGAGDAVSCPLGPACIPHTARETGSSMNEPATPPDDKDDLLRQALGGDSKAWDRLVTAYSSLVFGTALRVGAGEADAADITQSVWMELLEHGEAIRDPAALPRWLVVVARRKALRLRRSREIPTDRVPDERASVEPGVEDLLDQERRAEMLRLAMARLPARCRRLLLVLFETEKPNYREAARRLRIPVGSIGPTRARCLARLYRIFGEDGENPSA